MGSSCSNIDETNCPGNHCDGLERCFTCHGGLGDMEDVYTVGCWVASELLFAAIILPLLIFFAIIGVYLLHRSRIRQSSSINLCWKSLDSREWRITFFYLVFELVVLLDVYFWLLAGLGAPNWRVDGVLLGIFLFIVASCILCCGWRYTRRPQGQEREQEREQRQAQARALSNIIMVPDPSVRFHAAPAGPGPVVLGQPVPTTVVPGYPVSMSGGYYPVAVGVGPNQVVQTLSTAPPVAAMSADGGMPGSGGVFLYSGRGGVHPGMAPITLGATPTQVVQSSDVSYQPPPYTPPSSPTVPTVATVATTPSPVPVKATSTYEE
jgi:hypothetical protein